MLKKNVDFISKNIFNFQTINKGIFLYYLNKNIWKNNYHRLNFKYFSNKIYSSIDEEAIKQEIAYLMEKEDLVKANLKLKILIDYLKNQEVSDKTLYEINEMYLTITQNLRDMDKFQDSIDQNFEFLNFISEFKMNKADSFDKLKIMTLERISFDYTMLKQHDEAIKYLNIIIEDLENKIKEDRISIIEDKCSLALCLINLVTVKNEGRRSHEELNIDLTKCLTIYREFPDKLSSISVNLLKQLGIINNYLDNYEQSNMYLQESFKHKRSLGEDDDDESFLILKTMANNNLELENKSKALEQFELAISLKENLIKNFTLNSYDDLKQHYIDIAKIYEILGEEYFDEGKIDVSHNLIDKAIDNYLQFPLDPIFLAKCYYLLSEIFMEKKEYLKCIEYSKKYMNTFEKFLKENEENIKQEVIDIEYFTTIDLTTHESFTFKTLKYAAISYSNINENNNCKKYAQKAVNHLILCNKNENLNLSDFLHYQYELANLYQLMGNHQLALKHYDDVLEKLIIDKSDKIYIETQNESAENDEVIDINLSILDALYCKAEIYLKLEKYEESKKIYNQINELIIKRNIKIEEKRKEEIQNKIQLVNLKIKLNKK